MLWPGTGTISALNAANCAGIITEKGVIPKTGDSFDCYRFFQKHNLPIPSTAAPSPPSGAPPGFTVLDSDSVRDYVAADQKLAARVGPVEGKAQWKSGEIGDGNINYVYVVEGPKGAVVVKQGLPYIRCVGESWPLSQVCTVLALCIERATLNIGMACIALRNTSLT